MKPAPPYAEKLAGETYFRVGPGVPHEALCDRLAAALELALPLNSTWKILPRRSALRLSSRDDLRPDVTLVRTNPADATAAPQPTLCVEVLLPGDHHPDTVIKKSIYQDARLPTLWLVDPRYLNVEVYRTGELGFRLEAILANHEALTNPHLPGLALSMHDLFGGL